MRLPRRGKADPVVAEAAPVVAPPPIVYGYECPCGKRIESLDERDLTEKAWAHAHRCNHEEHAAARRDDPKYGHPDHFHYDDGSGS